MARCDAPYHAHIYYTDEEHPAAEAVRAEFTRQLNASGDRRVLFVGRSAGSRPLSAASPNKTIEGLAGGMLLAVVAAVVFALVGVHPFDQWQEGLKLGILVALVAPLGDLAESLIKRDLGIKDMGSVLPGHGGVLDRFDALLFVLPAVWYLARVSDFFLV